MIGPDGKPYQRGVFTAMREPKLSTQQKDWRQDTQFVGEEPLAFMDEVRKRAQGMIKSTQSDIKEQALLDFDQRVETERELLVRELWGKDAERARKTRIGQAMMHKIEQLARQSVRRQLNLEGDYVAVKALGFAQVINSETDSLRRELVEKKGAAERNRRAVDAIRNMNQPPPRVSSQGASQGRSPWTEGQSEGGSLLDATMDGDTDYEGALHESRGDAESGDAGADAVGEGGPAGAETAPMRIEEGALEGTWASRVANVATGSDLLMTRQNVTLPNPAGLGLKPSDMYVKLCLANRVAPISAVVGQLDPAGERLSMSGAFMSEGTAKALAATLPHMRHLGTLDLSNCVAHDGALSWLMGAAMYCPITALDASGNRLSEVGAISLARLISNKNPDGGDALPHPYEATGRDAWTVHDHDVSSAVGNVSDFFGPGPGPATPMRALYEADRTTKLSGTHPALGARSQRESFNPYDTIRQAATLSAATMVPGTRPTMRKFSAMLSATQDPAAGGVGRRPATAQAFTGGLRLRTTPGTSRVHSTGTCISAMAAEPATAAQHNLEDLAIAELPRHRVPTQSLRGVAMQQLEADDFASYREIKPLALRLPETKIMLKTLISLDLSDNPAIGSRAASVLVESLGEATRRITKVQTMPLAEIKLAGCGLTDPFMVSLGQFLEENQTVTALDLARNHLQGGAMRPLLPGLSQNQVLTHLDLSGNGLGDAAVCSLLRALLSIWREDPVRLRVQFLGIAGTRMGRRSTFALAMLLQEVHAGVGQYSKTETGLPPAFPEDWYFEVDISDHDLQGVAPVILARQLAKVATLEQRRANGEPRVGVVMNRVSTTCLDRQSIVPGDVVEGFDEAKAMGLIPDPPVTKGKKKGKGKGKGKKGAKGPKPRIVRIGELFKLQCADEEDKDILSLLVEHELLATSLETPTRVFHTMKLGGTRTYRLLGYDVPVGSRKTFDIRDLKWNERLPERGVLELNVLLGPEAPALLRSLHPLGLDASVRTHLRRPRTGRPIIEGGTTDAANDVAYWLPGLAGQAALDIMKKAADPDGEAVGEGELAGGGEASLGSKIGDGMDQTETHTIESAAATIVAA